MAPLYCSAGSTLTQQWLYSESGSRSLLIAGQTLQLHSQLILAATISNSLHQLSKDLLNRCYNDSARIAESDSSSSGSDSFHQLSKGLLSRRSRISFHQLSKGLLSHSYYDSVDIAESNSLTICTQQGDSVLG